LEMPGHLWAQQKRKEGRKKKGGNEKCRPTHLREGELFESMSSGKKEKEKKGGGEEPRGENSKVRLIDLKAIEGGREKGKNKGEEEKSYAIW